MRLRAQTNLQLYAQLSEAGYGDDDAASVGAAYDLAMTIFSGQYRGDGRPFVAHLVGTAAILARLRVPVALVNAGLLHAAYEFGDFGDGSRGVRDDHRRRLAAVVGADVEALVAAYSRFPWTPESIAGLSARATALSEREGQLVLLRLANLLDEAIDLGVLYGGKASKVLAGLDGLEPHLRRLATALGHPALAEAIAAGNADLRSAAVLPSLRRARASSFLLAPASYVPRAGVRLRAILTRLRRW